jgi:hypothetical protein
MCAEGIALIPHCAECDAHWLPAGDERWAAYFTDDEPPEVIFYCPDCVSGSSQTTRLSAFCPENASSVGQQDITTMTVALRALCDTRRVPRHSGRI